MFNDQYVYPGYGSGTSNGLLFTLDLVNKACTLDQIFTDPTDALETYSQGGYDAHDNGNVILGYGSNPVVKEYDSAGNVLMSLVFGAPTTQSYRAYRREWTATPTAYGPSVAVSSKDGTGWVSWNGDTETTTWAIYAGADKNCLALVAETSRDGFETAFNIPSKAAFVQVGAMAGNTFLMNSTVVSV
jgi:hypothetical protein